jgi:hypothetical protein
MRRTISVVALAAASAVVGGFAAPAAAFQFENGTIWPIAVGINGAAPQVVPPEQVVFLFRGQCPAGCQLNVSFADPSRAGSVISAAGGEPAAIFGNGDGVTVRVRQDRGGITLEVAGDATASLVPPGQTLQPPPPPSQTLQPPPPPSQTLQTVPEITAPPVVTSAPPAHSGTSGTTSSEPSGFVPPPPPPEYSGN